MFIYMQMDVEYDKITPAIELSLLYNAPDMLTENDINIPRKKIHIVGYNSGHVYIHYNGRRAQ